MITFRLSSIRDFPAFVRRYFKSWQHVVFFAFIVVVIISGSIYGIVTSKSNHPKAQATQQSTSNDVQADTPAPDTTDLKLPQAVPITDVTYLTKAVALANQHAFRDYSVFGDSKTTAKDLNLGYYEIGQTSDGSKIIAVTYQTGPGESNLFFIKHLNGKFDFLVQNNDLSVQSQIVDYKASLASTVTLDMQDKLIPPSWPANPIIDGQSFAFGYDSTTLNDFNTFLKNGLKDFGIFRQPVSTPTLIGSRGDTDFYKVITEDSTTFQVVQFSGTYKQLFTVPYYPLDELDTQTADTPSKTPKLTWSNGTTTKDQYFTAGRGCGLEGGFVVVKNVNSLTLTKVGTTPKGQALYQLPLSNPLVQKIYNEDYVPSKDVLIKRYQNLTLGQMNSLHTYFLSKNAFGDYVLYQDENFFVRGGCAKPAIYLYPTHTTSVNVKVGAQIVKSEPSYSSVGWQNVTAQPNGQLRVDGLSYNYLYWEGYGFGQYPIISNGTIVKAADVVSTVGQQLAQQGLLPNEINDFMAYWQTKLDTGKPYVRLTWLDTATMNELAPLNISPKPDSVIRVFLDLQGLDKPYALPHENLVATPRNGFTVVEWGGLARNGLN